MKADNPFIVFNGKYFREPDLTFPNPVIHLFDQPGISETMIASDNRVPFLADHLACLRVKFERQSFDFPEEYDISFFEKLISGLFIRNRRYKGSLVKLSFRILRGPNFGPHVADSFPAPARVLDSGDHLLLFWLEMVQDHPGYFVYKSNRWNAGLFTLPESDLPLWKMRLALQSEIERSKALSGRQEMVLTTQGGVLLEGLDSAVFSIIGQTMHTPALELGLTPRVIRQKTMEAATLAGYQVVERTDFFAKQLRDPQPNAFFIANDAYGLEHVLGIGEFRFSDKGIPNIVEQLNRLLKLP